MSTPIMTILIAAVRKASRGLQRDLGEVSALQISAKGPGDFVTSSDKRAEKVLRAELAKARPGYGFLGEEGGETPGTDSEHRFIIDPIDGTHNFMHGLPHFAVTVALERKGEIVAGVTYDPIADELFHAEKGTGAFLNNKRIRVGARRNLQDAFLVTNIPHRGQPEFHDRHRNEAAVLQAKCGGIRAFGSAALDLAYVAMGRFDGAWSHGLNQWDVATGLLLLREAGGFAATLTGSADVLNAGHFIATNADLLPQLKAALAEANKPG
jgi:myo-inositol-1(or 4)-monophosphatase